MWYSEVSAIYDRSPCDGRGRKKVSRKTRIEIEVHSGNGNKFTISV